MTTRVTSDLSNCRHRLRNAREDYAWMISNGESHDQALKRLGLTQTEWENFDKADEAFAKRQKRKGGA